MKITKINGKWLIDNKLYINASQQEKEFFGKFIEKMKYDHNLILERNKRIRNFNNAVKSIGFTAEQLNNAFRKPEITDKEPPCIQLSGRMTRIK